MLMAMKDKVRPIYHELQGYLSQAPREGYAIFKRSTWEQINQRIGELKDITKKDYDGYKMKELETTQSGQQCMGSEDYRANLAGLISRLHGEYFSDQPPPFAGMPSTMITQQQTQDQTTHVQILLDIQSKIDEKLSECPDGSTEKTFLEKVKASLSGVGNVTGLLSLISKTAEEVGLSVEQLSKLFS
jgi:hypothetical protein